MYVDESGDHVMDPSKWSSPDARYLGLTGVVIASETYRTRTHPDFEALKQEFFPHRSISPVILVRNRIIKKLGPFGVLSDPVIAARWEQRIIQFKAEHISQIFTVVIDKQAHFDLYGSAAQHPYNYCATTLTKMYSYWLHSVAGRGDVVAEARGGKDDRELEVGFRKFMETGNESIQASLLQRVITSRDIKIRPKDSNIAGLQLADLIAYPAAKHILLENNLPLHIQPSLASLHIIETIRPMYGQAGRVLLPQ